MHLIFSSENSCFKGILTGILSTVAITALLMAILSVSMLYAGVMDSSIVEYAILFVLAVSSFFGGYIALRINKKNGLLTGIIVGVAVLVILLALGVINTDESVTVFSLLKAAATVLPSAAGGVLGVNYSKKIKI